MPELYICRVCETAHPGSAEAIAQHFRVILGKEGLYPCAGSLMRPVSESARIVSAATYQDVLEAAELDRQHNANGLTREA